MPFPQFDIYGNPVMLSDPLVMAQLQAMQQPNLRWPQPGVSQPVGLPPELLQALSPQAPVPMPTAPGQGVPPTVPPMPQFVDQAPPVLGLQEFARQPASMIAGAMPPAATQPLGMLPPFLSEGAAPGITDPMSRSLAGPPPSFDRPPIAAGGVSTAPDVPLPSQNLSAREIQRQEVLQALMADAARKNEKEAALLAQQQQAAAQMVAAAPPAFGYDAMAWMFSGSPQEYMAKALAAKDAAMAGTLPPFPEDAGITSKEAYVAKTGRREYPLPGPWVGPALPPPMSGSEPGAKMGSAGPYMPLPEPTRKPRDQEAEAKRRELVTAHRRGQTPSGYRADIGQPSAMDMALLAGPQAAQMHEGVLGPMLEAERMKVQAEQEGHRLATLGSTLAAMMTANPNITPQQIAATREVMGMPSVPGTIPGGGPEDGNAVATFQAAAAAAGKTEEADKLLAEQDVAGIENLGKRIGLDNKVISQVIAEFERRPGGLLKAAEGLGKTIADIPLLKQGMTSTIDTLGPYLGIPSPRTPQPMAAEWIPAEPLEKVRRTALGTDEEAARARRWLIEHGYNTAVDFALP